MDIYEKLIIVAVGQHNDSPSSASLVSRINKQQVMVYKQHLYIYGKNIMGKIYCRPLPFE